MWYTLGMKTHDARSLSPEAQEAIRQKAVKAVLDGKKQVEVAQIFGVTRHAVGKWIATHRSEGAKALAAKRRGRPMGGSLKPWQAEKVSKTIQDRLPDQLKLPFYLWTREAVAQLIARKFNIELSVWTIGRYLSQWGFTPQKPIRRAFEQNSEDVQRWLTQEYPRIRAQAKREKAEIYWGDEMGLRSDHAAGRTYSLQGETPVIPGTGQRFGCNMVSAITNKGHLAFMVFRKRFRDEVFKGFLKRMVRQSQRKIFMIVDKHPVHRSRTVKRWLFEHQKQIRLFYLPSYSPELNPDEMLNQDVKSNAVGRQRAHTQNELLTNVRGYLRSRQRRPYIVQSYFQETHVQYAAQ